MPTAGNQLHSLLQTSNNELFNVIIAPPVKTGGFFWHLISGKAF